MQLENYETELLDLVDKTDKFEQVDNYAQAILEAKMFDFNFLEILVYELCPFGEYPQTPKSGYNNGCLLASLLCLMIRG